MPFYLMRFSYTPETPWLYDPLEQAQQHQRDETAYPKGSPWRYNDITLHPTDDVNEPNDDSKNSTRKQTEKVKTHARDVVELLEQARELMVEDNAMQPALEHLLAALHEAQNREAMLQDWYRRTYSTGSGAARLGR